jgi:hypothetical protein
MREKFISILKKAELWEVFIREFGMDWEATEWHYDGWWFDDDSISYRACDLFGNHSDGHDWCFLDDDPPRILIHHILLSHGFKQTHNGGDEEDGFYRMELDNG